MNSKEALETVKNIELHHMEVEADYDYEENLELSYHEENDGTVEFNYFEEIKTIEKALKVLEILKRYLVIETMDNETTSWEQVNCYLTKGKLKSLEDKDDFEKVKEWLENETYR